MTGSTIERIEVERTVAATPHEIFAVLTNPSLHTEIDGSGMLRGTSDETVLTGVGDVFLMNMHHEQFGDYVMRNEVTEFEPDRCLAWAPTRHDTEDDDWQYRWGFELEGAEPSGTLVREFYDCTRSPEEAKEILKDGTVWIEAMTTTLDRIAERFA